MSATVKGTLKHGLKIGETLHRDYELREAGTADLFDAEDSAPVNKRLAFQGALIALQLVKLGELSGPIDFKLIRKLHPADFDQLVADKQRADELGKTEPGG